MQLKLSTKLIFSLSIASLFLGFFFNEDSSGSGGFIADFKNTWGYIEALKNNLFTLPTGWTVHTPLHYILISKLSILINSELILRLVFLILSLSIPYLFFSCLKIKFPKIDKNNLIILSSIILILPAFRSSVIWLNPHSTGLIFFLAFLYFFLIWENNNFENRISKNVLFQIFFLALAVYTRQYYAYFYLYLMIFYFFKFKFKNFFLISLLVFVLSLPGFILIYFEPKILKSTFDYNLSNTILISSSIISFYLTPIYFIFYYSKKNIFNIFNIKKISNFTNLLIIPFFVIFLSFFFDYNQKIGGGIFLKFSYLFLNNNLIFLVSSLLGLILINDLIKQNKSNIFIILIFLIGFSAYMIFQKYFEPLFFMLVFLMLKGEIIKKFMVNVKNIYILYIYFFIYFLAALNNHIFQITKSYI